MSRHLLRQAAPSALAPSRLLRGLLAAALLLVSSAASSGARADLAAGYRMKINLIDDTHAPELTLFFTLLDPDDLPIPAKKFPTAEVYMDGKPIEREAEVHSLRDSGHSVAVAMVACGYQGYVGAAGKEQPKGFGELAKLFGDKDVATAFAYTNNIRNLTKDRFVAGGEAAGAIGGVAPSDTAYRAKLFDTLLQTIKMFEANGKDLPANRFIVLLSDGVDSTSRSDTEADRKILTIVRAAKKAGVRIMALGYSDVSDAYYGNLQLLARKTGGTFRSIPRAKDIPLGFKYVAAEIWGQAVVEIVPDMKAKRPHRFYVGVNYRGRRMRSSQKVPFELKTAELHFRWRHWLIIGGIVLAALLVAFAFFLLARKIYRKRKKKKELAELKAKGEAPPMEGDVVEMEAPPGVDPAASKKAAASADKAAGGGKAAAGGGKKAAAKAAAGGAAADKGAAEDAVEGPKVCPTCGRTMLPNWTKCMFCAAGISKAKAP